MSAPTTSRAHWVFAYGSNMLLTDLARWLTEKGYPALQPRQARVGTLPGHRLVWNYLSKARDGGAANIEPCPEGSPLPGLCLLVDDPLLAAIDHKEGRSYARARAEVLLDDEPVEAWVYRVVEERRRAEVVPPRRAYLSLMVQAAREHGLPHWHLEALERTVTLD